MKTLKRLSLAFFVLSLFTFQSCEKIKEQLEELSINIPLGLAEVIFTANPTPAGEVVFTKEVSTDIQKTLDDYGAGENLDISLDDIESIKPKTMVLRIVDDNSSFKLSDVEYVEIQIFTENKTEKQLVAKRTFEGVTENSVELDISDVELKDYLKEDKVSYEFLVRTNAAIEEPTQIGIKMTYTVGVKIFK